MAYTSKSIAGNLADTEIRDTAVGATVQYAYSGAKEIVSITLDNTAGSQDAFLRVWDATSGVTNGTTSSVHQFWAPGGLKRTYSIPLGLALSTGFAYAGSDTAGDAGTGAPATTLTLVALLKS